MKKHLILTAAIFLATTSLLRAETIEATVNSIDDKGVGAAVGTITFSDSDKGMTIEPKLSGLPAGEHGFHIHAKPDCGAAEKDGKMTAGLAAGGHFDPAKTEKHLGPEATGGHQGDLPLLVVNDKGEAPGQLLAPHLKVADLKGHAVMVHAGGDNYSDQPKPLGGGGARIACGILK